MFKTKGLLIEMSAGDYGLVMPFRVKEGCTACIQDLLDEDVFRLVISRAGRELLSRKRTWAEMQANDGILNLILTKEESQAMPQGLYTWQLQLMRGDEVCNTVAQGSFFVGASV